jgi:hypothetical protein
MKNFTALAQAFFSELRSSFGLTNWDKAVEMVISAVQGKEDAFEMASEYGPTSVFESTMIGFADTQSPGCLLKWTTSSKHEAMMKFEETEAGIDLVAIETGNDLSESFYPEFLGCYLCAIRTGDAKTMQVNGTVCLRGVDF